MFVYCSLLLMIHASPGGPVIEARRLVKGEVVTQGHDIYMVDFTEGLKKFDFVGDGLNYKELGLPKTECYPVKNSY